MRFINTNLFTPGNVIAIGAIIFFWGACAYLLREVVNLPGTGEAAS